MNTIIESSNCLGEVRGFLCKKGYLKNMFLSRYCHLKINIALHPTFFLYLSYLLSQCCSSYFRKHIPGHFGRYKDYLEWSLFSRSLVCMKVIPTI